MDVRPLLIIVVLAFAFSDKIQYVASLIKKPAVVSVEIVKPDDKFIEFSKDLNGAITDTSDKINLATYYDEFANRLVSYASPSIDNVVTISALALEEMYSTQYKGKYPPLKENVKKIFIFFGNGNDKKLSADDLIEMSGYFRGLAWNILSIKSG